MDLKGKLARLGSAGPGSRAAPPPPPTTTTTTIVAVPDASAAPRDAGDGSDTMGPLAHALAPDASRAERISELRARLSAMMARPSHRPEPVARPSVQEALPFTREASDDGPVHTRVRIYDCTQRHGAVPLHVALEARGEAVATLALDAALGAFDPANALYLDTETTGLSGGTGTLPFLIGVGYFEQRAFHVEQLFLAEPCDERALLVRLAARIERASALVTFNGKAFDMPLLRARYVMSKLPPPREPPHLDLLHVARRIYGERVAGCRLTTLERDVLGFDRVDDVLSGEIPARYAHFLRTGDAAPIAGVVEHNLWDVIAMAALLGELAARASGGDALGRFEPQDMAGLARTAFRAGAEALATALAEDAAKQGAARGQRDFASRANRFAATIHRRRGDHHAVHRRLRDALDVAPDDPAVHLALAKLYEHKLRDPERALFHARHALGAEDPDEHHRRVARLSTRLRKTPLRLPGID